MPESRRAFLHLGPPKTGTSYLQSVLWQATDALKSQGLTVLPSPAGAVSSAELMYAVRGRLKKDLDTTSAADVLCRFAAESREAPTPHVVVSQEQLAGAGPKQVGRLFACLPDHEIHVVVTVRSIARQVPSAWQERVKTRSQVSFEEYLRAVAERSDEGSAFWRYQDLPEVLRRWGANLPPERVHVVTVPPAGSAPDLLLNRFCAALGIDHTVLPAVATRSNSSLGAVQAEVLRRVNMALGDRLPRPRTGYSRVAKWFLAVQVLQPQGGRSPLLPSSSEQWCRDVTSQWMEVIGKEAYDVVGDLRDLLPAPEHFTLDGLTVGDDQVAASAIEALARIITLRNDENAETDRLRARVVELEGAADRGRARRLFGSRIRVGTGR
jgi:hypothetical protein